SFILLFNLLLPPPPTSTLFPYTTLFRSAAGVAHGNKLFGAAILLKSDLSVVIAETNNELENPLWHGEMHALKRFYELPKADRPRSEEHTSELQSRENLVCRLLLEKKKKK